MGTARPTQPRRPLERQVWDVTILSPSHPAIRHLQREAALPRLHGQKVWPSSFLLMDYLRQRSMASGTRILELGCGWGLLGIYCAKTFQAQVTGLDADSAVFPYLSLHAQRNGVAITPRLGTFAQVAPAELAAFDLIVGADICFWEELVDPLLQLIQHGLTAGVSEVLIADPSRPPFDDLCAHWVAQGNAEMLVWSMRKPVRESGRILRVVGRRPSGPGEIHFPPYEQDNSSPLIHGT